MSVFEYFKMFNFMRDNKNSNTLLLDMVEKFGEEQTRDFSAFCGVSNDDFQRVLIIEREEKEQCLL